MPKRITIIQGHPDNSARHLCHALVDAYSDGATAAGHEIRHVDVSRLDFQVLRSRLDWTEGNPAPDIRKAQDDIEWAEHLLIVYPLWLGTMPALLKGFFEQVLRPGFAIGTEKEGVTWSKRLTGRSARVVITMGMPALAYRWWFRAHSLKSLERNILKFVGIKPVRESLFGMVEAASDTKRAGWLDQLRRLGRDGR